MSNILYIKANVKPEGMSRTFRISDSFLENYKNKNPGDSITTLDLYKEGIGFLSADDLTTWFSPKTEQSRSHPMLKYAYQFLDADKYIISAPMWNLSVPAIFKAYIDYVTVNGITFRYTGTGPVGLCGGKKAIHFVTRGGEYGAGAGAAFEMGDRYLRTIFGFFGIVDFTTIAAEMLDVHGVDTEAKIKDAMEQAKQAALLF